MGLGKALATAVNISTFGIVPRGAVNSLFSGPKQASASPLPLPQPTSMVDAAARGESITRAKRAQATQTIYTSPLGISDQANTAKKVLLGQ